MINEETKTSTQSMSASSKPVPLLNAGVFTKFIKSSTTTGHKVESAQQESPQKEPVNVSKNERRLLCKSTLMLAEVYKTCKNDFKYLPGLNPRRCLTNPAEAEPGSCDNVDGDFVLYVNQVLVSSTSGKRYTIIAKVGQGTFGQVAQCVADDGTHFAMKIVRSKPAYTNQALVEHMILSQLNGENRCKYIVRYLECFMHQNHLCLVFELLAVNLYDLLRQNSFKGLSLNLIRVIVKQCLEALVAIGDKNIVHCDLKPENIMLQSMTSPQIKVIDFGSACLEHQAVYTYIQSRFYRSPEVLLRLSYARGIDVWSLACIGAELFLGLPLWPGTCEFNQMCKMVESIGFPPTEMLDRGKWTLKFFNRIENGDGGHSYQLKTPAQFEQENSCVLPPDRRYFRYAKVEELVVQYPYRKGLSAEDRDKEAAVRLKYAHMLNGILQFDPARRWTARQCLEHPFFTAAPHDPAWAPPDSSPARPPAAASVPIGGQRPPRHTPHTPPAHASGEPPPATPTRAAGGHAAQTPPASPAHAPQSHPPPPSPGSRPAGPGSGTGPKGGSSRPPLPPDSPSFRPARTGSGSNSGPGSGGQRGGSWGGGGGRHQGPPMSPSGGWGMAAGAVPAALALGPPGLAMGGGDSGGHGGAAWTESWPRQVMERQACAVYGSPCGTQYPLFGGQSVGTQRGLHVPLEPPQPHHHHHHHPAHAPPSAAAALAHMLSAGDGGAYGSAGSGLGASPSSWSSSWASPGSSIYASSACNPFAHHLAFNPYAAAAAAGGGASGGAGPARGGGQWETARPAPGSQTRAGYTQGDGADAGWGGDGRAAGGAEAERADGGRHRQGPGWQGGNLRSGDGRGREADSDGGTGRGEDGPGGDDGDADELLFTMD